MNSTPPSVTLEAEGGAVPLNSAFYVERPSDREFRDAVARRDSIVLVKGPRQVGKTSLLARGLLTARETGARVALIDFQTLASWELESADRLCLAIANLLAEQLDLDEYPEDNWEPGRGVNGNLTRYLAGPVFSSLPGPLVLALDEVDRLFTTTYSDELFAMFRSWHNRRAFEPDGPWERLTLAISFATEAHLFIRDLNQSPFNVGTRVTLRDFWLDEVADLNHRYGTPLGSSREVERLYALLGGHPFLTRKALHDLALGLVTLDAFDQQGGPDNGPFQDHLRRMLILLDRDLEIRADLGAFLLENVRLPEASFHRLRSAGVLTGTEPGDASPRCELYGQFLRQSLR